MKNPSKLKYRDRSIVPLLSFVTALIFSSAIVPSTIGQQPGDLDPTFGVDGKLTDWTGPARGVAIQPDGRIVVVGGPHDNLFQFKVARYDPDGTPDTTFGGGTGRVTTEFGEHYGFAERVVIQPDGKIVVAGSSTETSFLLARYNPDGSLDTTFGGGSGKILTRSPQGCDEVSADLAVQPDGKILGIIGSANYEYPCPGLIVRYNPDGSPDTTFGNGGAVVTEYAVASFAVQPEDGKILALRLFYPALIARFNSDGSLDTGFGFGGTVTMPTANLVSSIAMNPAGKIVAAGGVSGEPALLFRFNTDGSPDLSFDGDGIVIRPGLQVLTSVVIQPDGKILATGSLNAGIGLFRFNLNGSLDNTFGGGDGISTIDFGSSDDFATDVALDSQGRAVVVGGWDGRFAIARFLLETNHAPFDYDGDGKSDFSVYRPSNGIWFVAESGSGAMRVKGIGTNSDRIAPTDYDGDGKTDIAEVSVNSTDIGDYEYWFVLNSASGLVSDQTFGVLSPRLVPADYDGDSKADYAVWVGYISPSPWQIFLSESGSVYEPVWGLPGDKPVPADFDGDGRTDLAVWRPSDGNWYVANPATGSVTVIGWGLDGDIPVVGDYSGDGRADFAVYRPSNNTWYVMHSSDYSMHVTQWGLPNDNVTPGDYDGDGKQDLAVWRPSNGTWYVLTSANTIMTQQFGLDGDTPTESAFVY